VGVREGTTGWAWVVAAGHAAVLLAVAGRYGFHRDELYFLEAGQHLALGYVDQPPLTPLLARVQQDVLGTSPAALRVVPALVSAASVVLAAVLTRELGGGRRAQVVAALSVAGAAFVLTTGHLLSTATLDFALWLGLVVVAARLLRTGDARWWLAHGAVAGVALWNKHLVVLLTLALLGGLAADRRRDLLATWWLPAGGLVAVAVAAPTILWQATHGWPQVEMAAALADRLGAENRATLLPLQLLLLGPALVPLAWVGGRWLAGRDPAGRPFRPLLWAYAFGLLLTLVTAGRPYYPLPLLAGLVVAGAVATEARWPRLAPGLVVVNALVAIPLALPVLPATLLPDSPAAAVNDTLAEQVGWPSLARTVADVVAELPPDERDGVVLLTGSYGEAGALDRYGPALGLPRAHSGHNSYWHWRRPTGDDATVVAVRLPETVLEGQFDTCDQAATVDNGLGVDNEAQGAPVWVCRGLRGTWPERWPTFRHYS
jgi:4-amino-4-deoxy-L-arabinose transferase-like glycosyltransferase